MGERERAAVFNALFSLGAFSSGSGSGDSGSGARVLDVFAGSGALGFEAISRGAASVDFVENNAKTREIIKRNVRQVPAKSEVYNSLPAGQQYDIIFSDAPYDEPQWELVAKLPELLAAGGCLVVSHAKTEPIPSSALEGLRSVYSKTFANAQIDIFVK
jgi:16S rRNA (guanine966-N2)-methyltransferase